MQQTYSALQNIPIIVNLVQSVNNTGWDIEGEVARHISCNSGFCTLISYPVKAGNTYQFTYAALTLSGGYLAVFCGGTEGTHETSPDIYVETLTATSDGFIQFFSNANCTVQGFNIKNLTVDDGVTIVWSAENKKWSDTRTLYPEFGFSLYTNTGMMKDGAMYLQENGSDSRNNFFGVQYQSSIKFVEAKNPEVVNDFEALNYQANMLLVTTINGVSTPNGQNSTLIPTDFIKTKLMYNGLQVIQYQRDNVYFASFLPDSNEDSVNGAGMRGNYLICELITVDGSTPLQLFSVGVKVTKVYLGAR